MTKLKTPDKLPETPPVNPMAFTPTAPSQKPDAQGPVEKPGEPVGVTTREGPVPAEPVAPEQQKKPEHVGKPEDTPGKPGTGAPGQEKKPEVNPLGRPKK